MQRFGQSGVVRRSILELIAAELLKMMTGAANTPPVVPEPSNASAATLATPFEYGPICQSHPWLHIGFILAFFKPIVVLTKT